MLDIEEDKLQLAEERLLSELEKGRRSGNDNGWLDAEEVFQKLAAKYSCPETTE